MKMIHAGFFRVIIVMINYIATKWSLLLVLLVGSVAADGKSQPDVSSRQTPQMVKNMPVHEVVQNVPPVTRDKARNVVLMIGDGMGAEQVWCAWMCNHGKLNLEKLPVIGFSRTRSASSVITDSAAGGTAIACGEKTNNGWLGIAPDGKKIVSVMRCLKIAGKQTGLVVTKAVTDATPASFYAHSTDRYKVADITADLVNSGCRVIIGGGTALVSPTQIAALRDKGALVRLEGEKDCLPASRRGNFLEKSVSEALTTLEAHPDGFFLLVEGSQIDTAAHARDLNEMVQETLDFDRAVGVVLRWMQSHPDTLLVITADHQTGGLSLLGGDVEKGEVSGSFATHRHSGVAVPIYATGAGAAVFGGIQENTEFKNKILRACGF